MMPPASSGVSRFRQPTATAQRPIAAILALCLPISGTTAPSEIPVEIEGRVILVKSMIDGKGPHTLVLDTGATETVLTPRTAESLGMRTVPVSRDQKSGTVQSISVGDAAVHRLPVYVFDPPQAVSLRLNHGIDYHGILGHSFLSQFVTTVDYKRKVVTFSPTAAVTKPLPGKMPQKVTAPTGNAIPIDVLGHTIYVKGSVNGKGPLTFVFDTGAAETVLLPSAAASLGIKAYERDAPTGAGLATLEEVKVGNATVRKVPIIIHRPIQENPAVSEYHGILGYSFISNFKITINYRDKAIALEPYEQGIPVAANPPTVTTRVVGTTVPMPSTTTRAVTNAVPSK